MLECALAALMLKGRKKVHLVSRLHGYDVYFERGEYGYLPFRGHFIKNLDALFFISENGRQYLADKLKLHDTPLMPKLRIARLGFHSPFSEEITGMRNVPFRLVSTAWILENKRLKLIAEALTMLPHDVKIEWVHFGGYYGIDKEYHDTFIARVEEIRSSFPNISIRLMGSTPKEEILRFYRENEVHVFINASASEGIPVSMMEACRHGIPIIGTLVGGVGEILDDGYNGFHLNPNPAIEDIAIKLLEIIRMSDREYYFLRSNALQRWKDRYDSQRNYHRFLQELLSVWKLPQA
jgi:glycosyltransferase involved in cell wall biosynthesis